MAAWAMPCPIVPAPSTAIVLSFGPDILEVDWLAVDPALRRRDVIRELSRLVDRRDLQAVQESLVVRRRQPFVLLAFPLFVGQRVAERIEMLAGIHADLAVESPRRQRDALGHAVRFEHALVPAIDAGLAVADIPVAQHFVQRIA